MGDDRIALLKQFYALLDDLEKRTGGKRILTESHGRMDWPQRGIYFFFENGEDRGKSGVGPRVVRVGTHAVSANSGSALWDRLSQHRGNSSSGGGNHRGSIFRLLIGEALASRDSGFSCATWGQGNNAPRAIRNEEVVLERSVTKHLSQMPFLWLEADDIPSASSVRSYIERNTIALLSNYGKTEPVDSPSPMWLGSLSPHSKVNESGLWNQNYVNDNYDPQFLETLSSLIASHQTN